MGFRAGLAALACALSFVCMSAQAATTAEITRGLDWLQTQIAADGSLVGEANSVATSGQLRTEVARTLRELGREAPAGLLQNLAPDAEQSTEVASRAALAVVPGGPAASNWIAALVARRLADGSMPAMLGYGPTDLDMAWALRAMVGQSAATSLVQMLASRQQPDGSWSSTPYSPLHASALALCGLSPYASSNADAAQAASGAATYLMGQRLADGSWSSTAWLTAQAYECLHDFLPNQEDHNRVRDWLVARQAANGSWEQDPFVTALVLRALSLAAQPPLNPLQSGLRLRVVDGQTGVALSGVTVVLAGSANLSGSTDGTGSFQQSGIPPGSYQLNASYPGYTTLSVALSLRAGAIADVGVLRMSRTSTAEATTASVSGIASDAGNGQPLAGVLVTIAGAGKSALTDGQGRYSIDALAPGSYGISAAKSGYSSVATSFSAAAGGSYAFSPRLPLVATGGDDSVGCRIYGKLLKATNGAPVSGVSITLSGVNSKVTASDATGAYVLPGLVSGNTTIRVAATGYDAVQATAVLSCATPAATEFSPRLYPTATSPADANTASLVFTVVDSTNGSPLPGVAVAVTATGQPTRSLTSAADGRVLIDKLPLASMQAQLSLAGYDGVTIGVTIADPQRSDIGSVPMKKSRSAVVTGIVTNASSGAAVEGASVVLSGATSAQASTDSAGRFLLAGLASGSHTVVVSKAGYASSSAAFDAIPGGEYVVSPRLRAATGGDPVGCRLTGKITAAQGGQAIAGAQVTLTGTNTQSITTDASGSYSLDGLANGSTRVSVSSSGFDGAMFDFQLACAKPNSNEFSPRLYAAGQAPADANTASVTFMLVDSAKGTPLAGVSIRATPLGQPTSTVFTQADGKFTVGGLRQAMVQLQAEVAGYDGIDLSFQVTPLQQIDMGQLRLRPAGSDPLLPDLQLLAVSRTGAASDPQSLAVSGSVQAAVVNKGLAPTDRAVELLAFEDRNRNGRYDPDIEPLLGKAAMPTILAVGASTQVSVPVSGALLFRDAPIHVWVDSKEELTERDKTNNVRSTADAALMQPTIGTFSPVLKWQWTGATSPFPEYNQVMMAPVAGRLMDTNGDGKVDQNDDPCLVFTAFNLYGGQWTADGVIRVVNGRTGQELLSIKDGATPIAAVGSLALADLDNDGKPEIIAVTQDYRVVAYRNDGTKWWVSAPVAASDGYSPWGGATVADLDGDGSPEILYGRSVFSALGNLKWQASGPYVGSTLSERTRLSLPLVADLNGTGQQNVILGGSVYDAFGNLLWQVKDGFAAIGDFDGNGQPSIAVVNSGTLSLLSRAGQVIWTVSIPGGGLGGPPTIADVDGDGIPEIGVAGGTAYTVYRRDGSVLWSKAAQDFSSQVTGSTVFDFDGDGSPEVLYADEIRIRAFKGRTGEVLWDIPNSTGTAIEYPLVVDLDADGHADLVTVANDYYTPPNATALLHGVRVFQDQNNSWVNTRQLWNQHAYSITNINDDLSVPARPTPSWKASNTYRANKRVDGLPTATADLTASLLRIVDNGPQGRAVLSVRIGNGGALAAPAGVKVAFYGVAGSSNALLGVTATPSALGAGGFVDLSLDVAVSLAQFGKLTVVADDEGTGKQSVTDFDRSNNTLSVDVAPLATTLSLSLTTDAPSYQAGQSALFKATITNGGSFAKTARVRYVVQTVDGQAVTALPTGGALNIPLGAPSLDQVTWNTGNTYVGTYRVSADLMDPTSDRVLASASASFVIQASDSPGSTSLTAALQLDKATYNVGETVRLTERLSNTAVNQSFSALTLDITVLNPDGSQRWSGSAPVDEVAAGGLREFGHSLALGSAAPGNYTARLQIKDTGGTVLASDVKAFGVRSSAVSAAGLTGSLDAAPKPVAQGDAVSLSFVVHNQGNDVLADVPLRVRIVDPQADKLLAELPATTGALNQDGSFASSANWVANAPAGSTLVAVLTAEVGGRAVVLAQDNITIVAPADRLSASASIHAETRLLVLIGCPPGTSTSALATCLAERRTAVQTLLTTLGVPHKIVTSTVEFQTDLRCGTFNAYWLSAGGVKFDDALIKELREAVRRGEGLVLDGVHDARNSRLHALAGVKHKGKLPGDDQPVTLSSSGLFGDGVLATRGQPTRFEMQGGAQEARFDSGDPAIVSRAWGAGTSLLFAFDLVDTLLHSGPSAGATQQLQDLLARSTTRLASTPPAATVNDLVAVSARISNDGGRAANVELRAELPVGLRYVDASLAPTSATPAGTQPGLVTWRFTLAAGESRELLVRVAPDRTDISASLPLTVYTLSATGDATQRASVTPALALLPATGLAQAALDQVRNLAPTQQSDVNARNRAVNAIQQAQVVQQQGDNASALQRWLAAADELDGIASAAPAALTAAQSALAWAVEAASDAHCAQAACLSGRIDFYSTTPLPLRDTLQWGRTVRNACPAQIKDAAVSAKLWLRRTGAELLRLDDNLTLSGNNANERRAGWQVTHPVQSGDDIDAELNAVWQGLSVPLARTSLRVAPPRTP